MNITVVKAWFDEDQNLVSILSILDESDRLWNCDETGVQDQFDQGQYTDWTVLLTYTSIEPIGESNQFAVDQSREAVQENVNHTPLTHSESGEGADMFDLSNFDFDELIQWGNVDQQPAQQDESLFQPLEPNQTDGATDIDSMSNYGTLCDDEVKTRSNEDVVRLL